MIPVLIPSLAYLIWHVNHLLRFGETTTDEAGPPNPEPVPEPEPPVKPDYEVSERDFYAAWARMIDSYNALVLDAEIVEFQKDNPLTPAS
jgi:hypothetical protein